MKIIEDGRAPNPRRVRIFLAEKGIEVPFEQLDITRDEHKSAGFTKLNPWQRTPVLVLDDATAIAESVAICRYFEELHPRPALFGEGALGRAMVEMWNRRVEQGLFLRVAQCFRHTHPAMARMEVPQVPEWGEVNRQKALEEMRLLDDALADRQFIAGDRYSIADITALVAFDFRRVSRIECPDELKHLLRWHGDVSGRASAAA